MNQILLMNQILKTAYILQNYTNEELDIKEAHMQVVTSFKTEKAG